MHSILLQILRGNWFIDQEFAHSAGFLVKSMLENKLTFEGDSEKFRPKVIAFSENNSDNHSENSDSVSKNVAVISMQGPLMKHDQECGPAGMDTIGGWIRSLDADNSVGAIILKFDSPGGTVSGTDTLGNIISNCSKPIISFVDEMACSGAYWLSSQCDQIIAAIPRARIGSIGVMLSFMDIQPAWEKEGAVFHDIVSDLSPDKNKDFKEILSGNYDNYKKNTLNPLAKDFHAVVKSKREISDESILKGRVVFADEALSIGLIDKIANWEETLSVAFKMAEDYQSDTNAAAAANSNNPSLTKSQTTMKKFERVAAVVDVESFEVQDGFVSLSVEQMETINQSLADAETQRSENESLRNASQNHESVLQERDNDIAQRDTRISELEDEVASLRREPGDESASVRSASDQDGRSDEDASVNFYVDNEDNPVACMEKLAEESPNLKLDTF